MAMRGPKPAPVVDKLLRGNPGHRSTVAMFDDPPDGALIVPDAVRDDATALRHWRHYVDHFRHLKPGDENLLGDLCLARAIIDRNREKLISSGDVVKTPNGLPLTSPYLTIVKQMVEQARKLAVELAITPPERNRIDPHAERDNDPTAAYFDA